MFAGAEPPECRYHPGVVFERSPYYDESGLRLSRPIADATFVTTEGEVVEYE